MLKIIITNCFPQADQLIERFVKVVYLSQGQLLEMHLLESRLLDTFFKNVNCSTQKVSTARKTKECRTCTTFQLPADDKKSETARNFKQLTKFL
jgi:hypothetical protein